jgi:hypothetical protein
MNKVFALTTNLKISDHMEDFHEGGEASIANRWEYSRWRDQWASRFQWLIELTQEAPPLRHP